MRTIFKNFNYLKLSEYAKNGTISRKTKQNKNVEEKKKEVSYIKRKEINTKMYLKNKIKGSIVDSYRILNASIYKFNNRLPTYGKKDE